LFSQAITPEDVLKSIILKGITLIRVLLTKQFTLNSVIRYVCAVITRVSGCHAARRGCPTLLPTLLSEQHPVFTIEALVISWVSYRSYAHYQNLS